MQLLEVWNGLVSVNILPHRTDVIKKSAAIATVFTLLKFVIPIRIHTMMRTPMIRYQTHRPVENIPSAANVPT